MPEIFDPFIAQSEHEALRNSSGEQVMWAGNVYWRSRCPTLAGRRIIAVPTAGSACGCLLAHELVTAERLSPFIDDDGNMLMASAPITKGTCSIWRYPMRLAITIPRVMHWSDSANSGSPSFLDHSRGWTLTLSELNCAASSQEIPRYWIGEASVITCDASRIVLRYRSGPGLSGCTVFARNLGQNGYKIDCSEEHQIRGDGVYSTGGSALFAKSLGVTNSLEWSELGSTIDITDRIPRALVGVPLFTSYYSGSTATFTYVNGLTGFSIRPTDGICDVSIPSEWRIAYRITGQDTNGLLGGGTRTTSWLDPCGGIVPEEDSMSFSGRGTIDVADEPVGIYQNVAGTAPTNLAGWTIEFIADENNTDSILVGPFQELDTTAGSRRGSSAIAKGQSRTLSGVNLDEWYAVSATASQRFRWIPLSGPTA